MTVVAGYTFCFLTSDGAVRQMTVADQSDSKGEEVLKRKYGKVEVLSRAAINHRTLTLLHLKQGEFMEWVPLTRSSVGSI